MPRNLLSVEDLGPPGIRTMLDQAGMFAEVCRRPIPKVPALRGKTVATMFFEESTRTRLSFETAARRLSADVTGFAAATSSVKKGESVRDTVETVAAMGVSAIVIRHPSAGVPWQVARWVEVPVVNAGDGCHEHPTQALADCLTIRERLADGRFKAPGAAGGPDAPDDFGGLQVVYCGDIAHSRVVRSGAAAFAMLGARVTLAGPATLMPPADALARWPVAEVTEDLDAVIGGADIVYMLRIQTERLTEASLPSLREYTARWGLTLARASRMAPHAVVMHPGPMNRGVEIAPEVADSPAACITAQVSAGVAVRMAVLYSLLAATPGGTAPGAGMLAEDADG